MRHHQCGIGENLAPSDMVDMIVAGSKNGSEPKYFQLL